MGIPTRASARPIAMAGSPSIQSTGLPAHLPMPTAWSKATDFRFEVRYRLRGQLQLHAAGTALCAHHESHILAGRDWCLAGIAAAMTTLLIVTSMSTAQATNRLWAGPHRTAAFTSAATIVFPSTTSFPPGCSSGFLNINTVQLATISECGHPCSSRFRSKTGFNNLNMPRVSFNRSFPSTPRSSPDAGHAA